MRAPRLAKLVLRMVLSADVRDEVIRDLDDRHALLRSQGPRVKAWCWYWVQTFRSIRPAMSARSRPPAPRGSRAAGLGDGLAQDLRYALRQLRRNPGMAATVTLTLALGIGANSAIFSVVSGVLLHPLPYDESENLVYLNTYFLPETGYDFAEYAVGAPEYFDYKNQNRSMEEVAAVSTEPITITAGEGDPEVIRAGWVSPSMFTVLRTPPFLGRVLVEADGGAEPANVVVLGYDFWQRRFAGDSTVVGRIVDLGMEVSEEPIPAEVVGVMPPGFHYPDPNIQLWGPLPLNPAQTWRTGHWFVMIGRLSQGVTFEQAESELADIMGRWAEDYPDHHVGHGLFVEPLLDRLVADARPALLLLQGAVGFVLLIACANVASLLLARGEGRRRDVAVRSALGAGRGRLVRQLLTESLMLGVLGGGLGLLIAWLGLDLLVALDAGTIPRVEEIGLDERVLLFTSAAVLLSTLAFGAWPALREAAIDLAAAFKESGRLSSAGRGQMRVRKIIVVTEIALSLLLVVGAGLMVRSFERLLAEDPGFQTDNLLFARFSLPAAEYTPEEAVVFFDRLVERAGNVPGVLGASLISRPPLLWDDQNGRFHIEGRPSAIEGQPCCVASRIEVGEGIHRLLGVPLQRGRLFTAEDNRPGAPGVAIIDEETARQYWPGEDAIGKRIGHSAGNTPNTVVGVVGNVTYDGPGEVFPHIYHVHNQGPPFLIRSTYLAIRSVGEPAEMTGAVRGIVRELDPGQAIAGTYTMSGIEARAVARPRFIMTLLGVFASVALVLGAVGVYGVMAHSVAQRVDEIGVRRALGAGDREVVWMVVRQSLTLAGIGVAVGLVAALMTTRVLTGFLHEVSATDPWTFGAVALAVSSVGLLASWIPARRAGRVDPMVALRQD